MAYHNTFEAEWVGPFQHHLWVTVTQGNDQNGMLCTLWSGWHDANCDVLYVGPDLNLGIQKILTDETIPQDVKSRFKQFINENLILDCPASSPDGNLACEDNLFHTDPHRFV